MPPADCDNDSGLNDLQCLSGAYHLKPTWHCDELGDAHICLNLGTLLGSLAAVLCTASMTTDNDTKASVQCTCQA